MPSSGPHWHSKLETVAQQGEAEGSPYRALAAYLRALMARLEGGD